MSRRTFLLLCLLGLYLFFVTLWAGGLHIEVKRWRALPHVTNQSRRVAQLEHLVNRLREEKKELQQTVHPKWEEGQEREEGK